MKYRIVRTEDRRGYVNYVIEKSVDGGIDGEEWVRVNPGRALTSTVSDCKSLIKQLRDAEEVKRRVVWKEK